MAVEVTMPRQGQSVETCLILEWKKKPGERVKFGEPLCLIETDKASFEVEAPGDGVLLKIFFQEGDDVPVLSRIALLGEAGEELTVPSEPSAGEAGEDLASEAPAAEPMEQGGAAASGTLADSRSQASAQRKPAISPRARRLAREKGIDCSGLKGSGPKGRILVRDVERALEDPATRERAEQPSAGAPGETIRRVQGAPEFPGPREVIPLQGIRKRISQRLLASVNSTAQYTLTRSAGAENILRYRERLKNSPRELSLGEVSINDLILYATSRVLVQRPELNGHFEEERILQYKHVHLGFAVHTKRGLMVPVIRFADRLSLRDLSQEARRLARACGEESITAEELQGATFTVSNLGSLGIESFTPILNFPQLGILGVGGIQLRPMPGEGEEVVFKRTLSLSLTVNHQVIDGVPAARFLARLAWAIESFDLTLAG